MAINILDQDTINKIAAGEVIERPSSVVKELVENAIDAGATAITIEIKDGGISLIRITDNGSGIAKDDIKNAFLRHATSKIKSVEDLVNVASLGFRGEALSSIASVAQVELITKQSNELTGYRYTIEGGVEGELEEVGVPDGTTFVVRNLFFNTPVRRKFLKSAGTEGGYITCLVEHLALSHPDISFRFISNNQNKLHTSGNNNLKDIIYSVYGRDITRNMIEIKADTQDVSIEGYIGRPVVVRGNRNYENYYINGRFIKSGIVTRAIEEAYKGHIMPHNYPFTAIHFKINPSIIDVNVHPTKMELRFSKNEFVFQFVKEAVSKALRTGEMAIAAPIENSRFEHVPIETVKVESKPGKDVEVENKVPIPVIKDTKPCVDNFGKPHGMAGLPRNVDNFSAPQSTIKSIKPEEQIKPAEQVKTTEQVKPAESVTKKEFRIPEVYETNRFKDMLVKEDAEYKTEKNEAKIEQVSLFATEFLDEKNRNDYKVIGQLFETYWLIEYDNKFYMMDQHAAHEKVLYEKYMKHLENKTIDTQMIIPPVIIELTMQESDMLESNLEIFARMGFELEDFGSNSYKLTGIPASLPDMDYKQLLYDMIGSMNDISKSGAKSDFDIITDRIATMSCKAAVKGNNKMTAPEVKELIGELMQAENPYNCPHGRPTLIVMSKYDIEKKFKRIV